MGDGEGGGEKRMGCWSVTPFVHRTTFPFSVSIESFRFSGLGDLPTPKSTVWGTWNLWIFFSGTRFKADFFSGGKGGDVEDLN